MTLPDPRQPSRILLPPEQSAEEEAAGAIADLGFIRSTMERASAFTAVPGWGGVVMGALALSAGAAARTAPTPGAWMRIWLVAALAAAVVGIAAMRVKAHRMGGTLTSAAGRRFALAFGPALAAGIVLTLVLWRQPGAAELIPGTWLLLYGVAVTSAGTHSVRVVPAMGLAFVLLGMLTLLQPTTAPWTLPLGFGLVHIVGGLVIARRHGG